MQKGAPGTSKGKNGPLAQQGQGQVQQGAGKNSKTAKQRQPSPQCGQQRPTASTAGKKATQPYCRLCETSEHNTFNKECPLAQGRDASILNKLTARKICTRCVRSSEICQARTCDGGFHTRDKNFVRTDCKTCKHNGKPVNMYLCGHDVGEQAATAQQ